MILPAQKNLILRALQDIVSENVLLIPTAIQDGTVLVVLTLVFVYHVGMHPVGVVLMTISAAVISYAKALISRKIRQGVVCKGNKGFSLFDKSFSLKHLVGIAVVMVATWGL